MDGQVDVSDHVQSSSRKKQQKYKSWSPEEEKYLLQLLVEEAKSEGRLINGQFRREVIIGIVLPKLNEKFNKNKEYRDWKNKQQEWKKRLEPIERLRKHNYGFAWDPITRKFTCTDDVWAAIEANDPEAPDLRDKVFEDYDDLKLVCGEHLSLEKHASGLGPSMVENKKDNPVDIDVDQEEVMVDNSPLFDSALVPTSCESNTYKVAESSRTRKRKSSEGSNNRGRVSNLALYNLAESLHLVGSGLHALAEALRGISYRNAGWVDAIMTTPGITERMRWAVLDLETTQDMKDCFVAMSNEARLRWLRFKLRPSI